MALDALENQPDELFWAHEATAPLCIGSGRGFGSDNFVERPALLFEGRDLVPHSNQQIAVEGELIFSLRAILRLRLSAKHLSGVQTFCRM
jgi:hypothetical protein